MLLPSGRWPHYLPSLCSYPAAVGRTAPVLYASTQRPAAALPQCFMLLPSGLRPHYPITLCSCPAAVGRTASVLYASTQRPAAALPQGFVLLPSGLRPHCLPALCFYPAAVGRTTLQYRISPRLAPRLYVSPIRDEYGVGFPQLQKHVAAPAALGGRELPSMVAKPPSSDSSLFASFCS